MATYQLLCSKSNSGQETESMFSFSYTNVAFMFIDTYYIIIYYNTNNYIIISRRGVLAIMVHMRVGDFRTVSFAVTYHVTCKYEFFTFSKR